jgi:uncharacterized Zn finger protein (UPF0148 family)
MDKFGVVTVPASKCPLCGSPVKQDGTTIRCPIHGTEPFEGNLSDETPEEYDDSAGKERVVSPPSRQS